MHEDTEEINALLYSDSDDKYCEEEASTGHSPIEPMVGTSTEVAASSVLPAAKRKRIDVDEHEPNASLLDTASSAGSLSYYHAIDSKTKSTDGKSSYVRGEDQDRKRIKRERILETIGVLRRIIDPRWEGKGCSHRP
ncbi:transcription factor bHLH144-like [Canna indica]|uniref:Transcription factor bHLH144-like n=1 Tax=Canna indica TaxID=4628 RepID=A0AAQ3QHN3_9LILI|nr:transcription factor bHLH144-like [Canna indica]